MLKNITSSSFRFWLKSIFIVISMAFAHSVNAQQPLTGFPYTDSFKFPTSPGTVFGGQNDINLATPTIGSAFLTASQTAVTAFGSLGTQGIGVQNSGQLVTADASGGGYLRLTRSVQNQTGFARNTRTFPTSQGLSISFEYYTYGNVADGIVFFLYDADVVNRSAASNTALGYSATNGGGFQIGAYGGSLGYAQRTDNSTAGLSRGFLGIGFDEFGNFGLPLQGRQGGYSGGRVADWVTLRGDGDGAGTSQPGYAVGTNYEYLIGVNTSSATAMAGKGGLFNIASAAPASRTAGFTTSDNGYRKARIIIEYVSASQFTINVYIDQNSGSGMVTHHVIQNYTYNSTAPAPANLSYGFSASTGGSTNVHEIRAIDIAAPLSVAFTPVAASATVSTLEDNAVSQSLIDYAYDQNGNSQLNWATGLDLDPTFGGVQASRTIAGQGTFTSNASGTVTFTPVANYNGTVSTDFTIADFGNASPTIAVATSNPSSLTITVTPVNDPPTTASKTVSTNEDVAYPFTAADFALTDDFDTPANTLNAVQITTLPATGTLLLAGAPVAQGASITLAQINAASFTYLPPTNESASPMTSFTFRVQDNGGITNGGIDVSLASATMTINVLPSNDAPSGTNKAITTNEDVAYTFTTTDFGFTDAFDTPANNFLSVLVSPVGSGSLTLNGVPISVSTTINAASITANQLVYTPPLNSSASPTTTFTFQVRDDGGTANGGVDTDQSPNTITINVPSINDAPSGANKTITTNEDVAYTFTTTDFGFTDAFDTPPNNFLSVLVSPVASGSLTLNGVPISVSTTINAASITANQLVYTPALNSIGTPVTTFTFQVRDDGGTASGGVDTDQSPNTISINVTSINDAPAGADKIVTTNEDVAYTFTTADFGFTDAFDTPPNNFLSLIVSPVAAGSLTLNGVLVSASTTINAASVTAGLLVYTPALNANGTPVTTFTFQVQDDGGTALGGVDTDQSPNTISINVTPVNDLPVVADIPKAGAEDATITFTALDFTSKFTDVDNDALTKIKVVNLPANGILKLNGVDITVGQEILLADLPNITFVPTANFNGSTTFKWNGFDGTAYAAVDEDVNITITPVNDLPVVADIPKAGAEDATITFTALDFTSKFTDVDNDALTKIKVVNLPANGLLKLNGVNITVGQEIVLADLPNITFVPTANFNGSTTFKWNGFDGTAYAAVDEDVNITITPVNDLPVVADIPKAGAEDATISFTALDFTSKFTDVDNDALTKIKVVNLPANGLLKLNGVNITVGQEILLADLPNITFVPTTDFNGSTTFKWNGFDGTAYAAVDEDVNITITPVNDAPVANPDVNTVTEDVTLTVALPGLLTNDTDVEGTALTITQYLIAGDAVTKTVGTPVLIAGVGTISIAANGSYSFIPVANYAGTIPVITYTVSDGALTATSTLTLTMTPVNDAPSFVKGPDQSIVITTSAQTISGWASSLSKGPADEAAQTLNFTVSNNNNALFTVQPAISATGVLTYTIAGTAGTSTVTVLLKDNGGTANGGVDTFTTQTFTITISASNAPPVAVQDNYSVVKGGTLTVSAPGVLSNDTDANPGTTLRAIKVLDPAFGTITLSTDGSFVYVHGGGIQTSDSFTYKVNDGTVDGNTVTVTIAITPVSNSAPVAQIDSYNVAYLATTAVSAPGVLLNDTDINNDPMTAIKVTDPLHGTLTAFNSDGSFKYQHTGASATTDSFTYKISDGKSEGNTVTVTLNIIRPNRAPVAFDDLYGLTKGSTLTVSSPGVLSNDSDPDGDITTAIKLTDPVHGILTFNSNGSFTYVHGGGTNDSDSFTYKINDGKIDGNVVTVSLPIATPGVAPVIADINKSTLKNKVYTFSSTDFSEKFLDLLHSLVKIKIVTLPSTGILKVGGFDVRAGMEINALSLASLTFSPGLDFTGVVSFQYNASCPLGYAIANKNVNITVLDPGTAPVAVGDSYTASRGGVLTVALPGVLANDTDGDGHPLTATKVTDPVHGSLVLNLNGSFVYVHNGNTATSDSFTYKASDPFADSGVATVNITIPFVNLPPILSAITKIGNSAKPIPFKLADFVEKFNDSDSLVNIRIETLPLNGILKLYGVPVTVNQIIGEADIKGLTFEPTHHWNGTTSFLWKASDGTQYAVNSAPVNISVTQPSDPLAKIGLAKSLISTTPNLNGTYDLEYLFTVKNYGPNDLVNISIKDNLSLAFIGADVKVKKLKTNGDLKANTGFNGSSDTEMLVPSASILNSGQQTTVELVITVKLGILGGVFQNMATAEGESLITGFKVNDMSTQGLKPDPNGNGDVSSSVPTEVKLDLLPSYVPQGFSPNGDGTNDKFVVQNADGKQVSLEMYNRWGNRVYKSEDYKNDWGGEVTEGFFLGRDIPDGTYYYIIIIDKKDKYTGFITVNR